ncbi:MAG: phytanoyl-CoA dioxygenase family protein, partial [Acidimicrobiales bacterium]
MTTAAARDAYPTRAGGPLRPVERAHPVVHPGVPGPLSAEDLGRFDRDGYLVVDRLVGPAAADRLRDEAERLATDPEVARSGRVVREPEGDAVRSVFEVHLLSPLLGSLVADRRLVGMAEQLLGSRVYVHQSRVNCKPAFCGDGFAWHSDFETWHAEDGMPTPRAVSLSLALTPNYVHNGSLMLVAGSHRTFVPTADETPEDHYRRSLRRQEVGVPDGDALTALVERSGGIAVVTGAPGSAVLFDSNAMHGSTENITPFPRTNLFAVYN